MDLKLRKIPISIISGILVIVIYCAFTFISFVFFPTPYNPIKNWLSDLGNSSFNPNGAIFYNLGCILTGAFLFPFFIGLYKWYMVDKSWHKILIIASQIIGCCSALALIMIGVFSEDFNELHIFWSGFYFYLNLSVLILGVFSLFWNPKFFKLIGIYGIVVSIINLLFAIVIIIPILEWFTVFSALSYVGLLVFNMYKNSV